MNHAQPLGPVEAQDGEPLYQTVKTAVRAAIDSGVFSPRHKLPSTKALSDQLGVSLVTVHRALQELVASGVLRRGQGKGTFVHENYADRATLSTGLRFGLVFHKECSLADYHSSQILEGIRRKADKLGIELVFLRFEEDWRNECQGYFYLNTFGEQKDHSQRFTRSPRTRMSKLRPVMVVGASRDQNGISTIDIDNFEISRQAVDHLWLLGHRRIGYVGAQSEISHHIDRWKGFCDATARLGLVNEPLLSIRSAGRRLDEPHTEALREMLESADRPTAIFASGYSFALDVYHAAAKVGLRIPEDLSIVGVDDPPGAELLNPPLTTFRQPLMHMGEMAARGLFDLISQTKPSAQQVRLQAELIIRRSTATPAMSTQPSNIPGSEEIIASER